MEPIEYENLAQYDRHLWWFHGLHAMIAGTLQRSGKALDKTPILDAGCGTGGLLQVLSAGFPSTAFAGIDIDPAAASHAGKVTRSPVCVGSVNDLPFADNRFAAILSADVLCHEGVAEDRSLGEFKRCLEPGGALILNLPAYNWMLAEHDRAVHNVRRYTAGSARFLLERAGFARIQTRYWNTTLFPLMVLRRKLRWRSAEPQSTKRKPPMSDVALLPAPIETLFRAVIKAEAKLIETGLAPPFGGSILAKAVKPTA